MYQNLDNLLHMDGPKVSWQIKVKTYCVEISNWTCWKDSCVKSLFISTVWRDFSHELMIICNQISDYCLNYCHYFFILYYSTLRHAAAGFGTLSIPRRYYKKVWYWISQGTNNDRSVTACCGAISPMSWWSFATRFQIIVWTIVTTFSFCTTPH